MKGNIKKIKIILAFLIYQNSNRKVHREDQEEVVKQIYKIIEYKLILIIV